MIFHSFSDVNIILIIIIKRFCKLLFYQKLFHSFIMYYLIHFIVFLLIMTSLKRKRKKEGKIKRQKKVLRKILNQENY